MIVYAQEESRLARHDHIGTDHLLLGLVRQDGIAATALGSLGVTLDAARAAAIEVVGRGRDAQSGHIPFTGPAKQTLERSLEEALRLGHEHIGTSHLLLGLLDGDADVAGRVLGRLGVGVGEARQEALRLAPGSTAEND